VERARRRIAETEPALHAWVEFGVATGTDGLLRGAPLGVKDIIDVGGLRTRCGSSLRADAAPAVTDAAIVAAWRAAGAVPIGKTVTTEFAYFSPGPTGNPAAPGHTPGGSSSGSAAAVAAGQVPLALGSQTAGSVTRPASYCGVAALVMTPGRFPTTGVTGLSPTLDSHGVFAARTGDLGTAFAALTGEAPAAPNQAPRLLCWNGTSVTALDPTMRDALAAAGARLRDRGAVVAPFPLDDAVADAARAHAVIMAFEAARERAAELADPGSLSRPLLDLLTTGRAITPERHRAACAAVAGIRARVLDLLAEHDAILGPAAPGPAPYGLSATGDPVLSRAWQALGLPVVTVPGLRAPDGRPLGLQLVGRPGAETDLIAIGRRVEQALGAR
jgi:Asp-tRNA(Asn)/Glu-tRNA(Gln) amidotransferase A subunit family amidase